MRPIFGLLLALATASPSLAQRADAGADTDADADADAGTDAAADAGADTDAAAVAVTTMVPPKIAVVVAGDPEPGLQAAAAQVESEVVDAGLRTPVDPALRGALRGETAQAEDGLEGLRSIRRGLGVDLRKDLASYKRLGAIAGADALVVLRREGTIKLEVFDVSAAQFYEGVLEIDRTSPEERVRFIERRAEVAQARWEQDPAAAAAASAAAADADGKPVDEPEKKRWIKKAWPYLVVGVLLAAGVTYLIIDRRRTDEPGPPLLRFRPGEE